MRRKQSARSSVRDAKRAERDQAKVLKAGSNYPGSFLSAATQDSFQNFAAKLGMGTDNLMSGSSYGFNPITRNRTLLEWIHRGSWLGGVAVDLKAQDMTRAGVELKGEVDPDDSTKISESVTVLGLWPALCDTIKWARLYGGAIAYIMVDGQDPKTPLRIETVGKGAFKGLLVLDRWMVDASVNDLVTELGPNLGKPKYYEVIASGSGIPKMKIHYSRVIRLEGIQPPFWQRMTENMWGISVIERLYDRMIAFDSATTGAAQLVYKSYLRTFKVKEMREMVSSGGPAAELLAKYVDLMRRFQGIEGMSIIDAEDSLEVSQHSAFSGISEALSQFGQQLCGALQIPASRLFGQAPAGLGTADERDLRTYYDGIKQEQMQALLVPLTRVYRIQAMSLGIRLPEGFSLEFRSLWQLSETDKAQIAQTVSGSIGTMEGSGIITRGTALKELKQSSHITGVFSNITNEDIEEAELEPAPLPELEEVAAIKAGADPVALREEGEVQPSPVQKLESGSPPRVSKRPQPLRIVK